MFCAVIPPPVKRALMTIAISVAADSDKTMRIAVSCVGTTASAT